MKEFLRTVKFTLFSLSAGIIQFGSEELLHKVIGWPVWLAHLIALILSVVWNFTLNRKFTFQSASNIPKAMLLVLAYYVVFTPLSTLIVYFLTSKLRWDSAHAELLIMLVNFVTEFLYQRLVVFRDSVDTAAK